MGTFSREERASILICARLRERTEAFRPAGYEGQGVLDRRSEYGSVGGRMLLGFRFWWGRVTNAGYWRERVELHVFAWPVLVGGKQKLRTELHRARWQGDVCVRCGVERKQEHVLEFHSPDLQEF